METWFACWFSVKETNEGVEVISCGGDLTEICNKLFESFVIVTCPGVVVDIKLSSVVAVTLPELSPINKPF